MEIIMPRHYPASSAFLDVQLRPAVAYSVGLPGFLGSGQVQPGGAGQPDKAPVPRGSAFLDVQLQKPVAAGLFSSSFQVKEPLGKRASRSRATIRLLPLFFLH
ncbi:hypothetical protein [Marinococcus luteus]|uniref:hypothetical protein n=1 Tax=Marinococcus luteus TaxID=1122204 RepID=UPI002ACEDD38|nr:hypothetical protein [Marinococcus luteus]